MDKVYVIHNSFEGGDCYWVTSTLERAKEKFFKEWDITLATAFWFDTDVEEEYLRLREEMDVDEVSTLLTNAQADANVNFIEGIVIEECKIEKD